MASRTTAFENRTDAGIRLAMALRHLRGQDVLVLALPRGGVPVAFEVARALHAELDLLFVRKLGAPGHEELGIGAVVDGANPQVVLNDELVRQIGVDRDYIDRTMQRELVEIERRRERYLGQRAPQPVSGRTIVLVDDGIATGGTIRAALKGLRRNKPGRLILAVPVAPAEIAAEIARDCDEFVCVATPQPFYAVGAHYQDFTQTSDEEVVRLLDEARSFATAKQTGA